MKMAIQHIQQKNHSHKEYPKDQFLGPILFNLFVAPLGELCRAKGVSFQGYADDTQNYLSF